MLAVVNRVDRIGTPKQITQNVGPSILPLGLAFPGGFGSPARPTAESWEHFYAKAAFPVGALLALSHLKVPHHQVTPIAGMGR